MKTINQLRNIGAAALCFMVLLFPACTKGLAEDQVPKEEDPVNLDEPEIPDIPDVYVEGAELLTLGNPGNFTVNFGTLSYGATPVRDGGATNLSFVARAVKPIGNGYHVYGYSGLKIMRAFTEDGKQFSNHTELYVLPDAPSGTPWMTRQMAVGKDKLLFMAIARGQPATHGHYFYSFGTQNIDTDWSLLQNTPVYRGQDAFQITWNEELGKFVNYQTAYQRFTKQYPDNLPDVRRVLHIRTTEDGVNWEPGDSFGAEGPYLDDDVLIVPDEKDPQDMEFYRFGAMHLGEFWAGVMVNYSPKPQEIPNTDPWPHGPFLSCEWWISQDGLNWKRPFRDNSRLDGASHDLTYNMMQPIEVENELRWVSSNFRMYSMNRYRMFYTYSRSNADILTKPIQLRKDKPIALLVDFFDRIVPDANRDYALQQGYIIAELVDHAGNVIPGFERGKCVFNTMEDQHLREERKITLKWGDKFLPETFDQPVQLRILFKDVRLYSVMY